jgi:hypothetical protein
MQMGYKQRVNINSMDKMRKEKESGLIYFDTRKRHSNRKYNTL